MTHHSCCHLSKCDGHHNNIMPAQFSSSFRSSPHLTFFHTCLETCQTLLWKQGVVVVVTLLGSCMLLVPFFGESKFYCHFSSKYNILMITFVCNMLYISVLQISQSFRKYFESTKTLKNSFFFNYIVKLVKMTEQILQMKYLEAKYKTATYKVILNRPWL